MSQAQSALSRPPARHNPLLVFWQLIVSPRAALTHLRAAGGPSWLWPAGLALLVFIAASLAVAPITRAAALAETEAMLENYGADITPEEQAQIEQVRQLTSSPLLTVVIPLVTGAIGLVIGWAFRGGVLFLFGLLFGGHARFADMFRMAAWTTLPDTVRVIVSTLGTLAAGRTLTSGLAFLVAAPETGVVPALGPALWGAFLGGIDVYWLWSLILTTIGVAVTASTSLRKGLLVALAYWLLTVLLSLAMIWVSLSLAASAGFGGG